MNGARPLPAARVWLRGAARRPARAAVVIVTLTLMTIGTVSALVAADSLENLFFRDARAEWGAVDVEVTSVAGATFSESLSRVVSSDVQELTDAFAPRLILRGVVHTASPSEPGALFLGLGPEEQTYPPFVPVAGASRLADLGPATALVNERLAARLDLGVGDRIDLVVGVPEILEDRPGRDVPLRHPPRALEATFGVAGIVANTGVADLHRTPNVLLRRDALQRVTGLAGKVTHLHMTAAGEGTEATDRLVRGLESMARRLGLGIATVAEDALAIAEDEGGQFRAILLTLALLVIGAAAVAAVEMLTTLAEDRSREIGVLRALGTRRRMIVGLVTGESLVYASVAAVVGTILALPAAHRLAALLADHFAALSAGRGREQVRLVATVDPATVAASVAIVLASALLAGRAAGRRLAAVDPDRLLRGPLVRLPGRELSARRPVVVALLGSLVLGMGLTDAVAADALRYIGLTLLLTAGWLHLRRSAPDRRRLDERAAVAGLVWATLGAALLADFSQGYETGFGILTVAGLVTVVGLTVLLSRRFRGVMRLLRAYAPRGAAQAALRTAGAYAEEAAGRTGRLFATFGIVLFMAAALHVLGNATDIDVARQAGGFDVMAHTVVEPDEGAFESVPGLAGVVDLSEFTVPEDRYGVEPDGGEGDPLRVRYPVRLLSVEGRFPAVQQFRLAESLPAYPTAVDALTAVQVDGDKAVVDRYSRPPGAQLGDDVVLDLGPGPRRYELIAVLDTFLLNGVFVSETEFGGLAAPSGATFVLARGEQGVAPGRLAGALDEAGHGFGLGADTVSDVAEDVVSVNRTFTDVFALLLVIGLVVALVAVAAMLARTVQERRPYLGVLRAVGFRRRTVILTVATEPVAVALVGGVTGLLGGLAVLRVLFAAGFSDLAFVVDVPRVATTVALVAVLLVAVCAVTAWRATPGDPADDLHDAAG